MARELAARTEDEFLGRREHVEREGDLILVLLLLYPFCEVGRLREEEGEGGDGEEAYKGVGEGCVVGERHVSGELVLVAGRRRVVCISCQWYLEVRIVAGCSWVSLCNYGVVCRLSQRWTDVLLLDRQQGPFLADPLRFHLRLYALLRTSSRFGFIAAHVLLPSSSNYTTTMT